MDSSKETRPIDSLVLLSKLHNKQTSFGKLMAAEEMRTEDCLHSIQSVFLGSDRRYNRYWLFLGPCTTCDPGHRRVYFESSEDGHWEVMDSTEVSSIFLFPRLTVYWVLLVFSAQSVF